MTLTPIPQIALIILFASGSDNRILPESKGVPPATVLSVSATAAAHEVGLSGNRLADRHSVARFVAPLGPAPKVHLTAEQIAEVAGGIPAGASGDVLLVDCHGNYDHDTIQGAIDAASDGDVVIVLPNTCTPEGHYFENIDFLGKAIVVQSLDPENSEIVGATIINGSSNDLSVVAFASGESSGSVLDGLTITGGTGTPVDYEPLGLPGYLYRFGGGVLCLDSSPTIRNCRLLNNQAVWGGGMVGLDSNPTVLNCFIAGNLVYTDVQIVDELAVAIYGNGAGLMFTGAFSAAVANCWITENTVQAAHDFGDWPPPTGFGGGITAWKVGEEAQLLMHNCFVIDNHIVGAPLDCILNCATGGGLLDVDVETSVSNTLFIENTALNYGGMHFFSSSASLSMSGCTFAENESLIAPHVVRVSTADVTNCIIQHNTPGNLDSSSSEVTFSNVGTSDGSTVEGEGNINQDPIFVDPENGDYHLSPNSPCIDTGDPDFMPAEGETDIDGDPRVLGTRVDMGADEFAGDCKGDLNGNGFVGALDLAMLLGAWGPCPPEGDCAEDLDGDSAVGPSDLAFLLGHWGPCE